MSLAHNDLLETSGTKSKLSPHFLKPIDEETSQFLKPIDEVSVHSLLNTTDVTATKMS